MNHFVVSEEVKEELRVYFSKKPYEEVCRFLNNIDTIFVP